LLFNHIKKPSARFVDGFLFYDTFNIKRYKLKGSAIVLLFCIFKL